MTRNSIEESIVGEEFNRKQTVASRELNCSEAKGIRKKTWFKKFSCVLFAHESVFKLFMNKYNSSPLFL